MCDEFYSHSFDTYKFARAGLSETCAEGNSGDGVAGRPFQALDGIDAKAFRDQVRNALNAVQGLSFALMETDLDDLQSDCVQRLAEVGCNLRTLLLDEGKAGNVETWAENRASPEDNHSLRPMRILAADDSQTNHIVMQAHLRAAGYNADFVNGGRAALEALNRQHYDLLLLDIEMPDITGLEVTRRVRAAQASAEAIPLIIIAVTANCTPTDAALYTELGFDGLIAKPVCRKQLQETLRNLA